MDIRHASVRLRRRRPLLVRHEVLRGCTDAELNAIGGLSTCLDLPAVLCREGAVGREAF